MIINSRVKDSLPIDNLDNYYVVTDFDRTITNGSSQTSWSILASSDLNMVDNSNHKEVITVGFITPKSPKESLISNFDIVCEDNDDYLDVQKTLFKTK